MKEIIETLTLDRGYWGAHFLWKLKHIWGVDFITLIRDLAGRTLNSIQARIFSVLMLYKILEMKYEGKMEELEKILFQKDSKKKIAQFIKRLREE